MHSIKRKHLRFLGFLALSYQISFFLLFFVTLPLFDFSAARLDSAFRYEYQAVFADSPPSHYPLISLFIFIFIASPFVTAIAFVHVRVQLLIPPSKSLVRGGLFVMHFCLAANVAMLITAVHYAELFAQSPHEASVAIQIGLLQIYLYTLLACVEHIILGVYFLRDDRRFPRWLIWGMIFFCAWGLVQNFFSLNTDLPPIRILGGGVGGAEVTLWMFYLFFYPLDNLTGDAQEITPLPEDKTLAI